MVDLLFTPKAIGSVKHKNRIIMSAIHLGYANEGRINNRILRFYEERAKGEPAAIIVGGMSVSDEGSLKNMISISSDGYVDGLKKLADTIKLYDCRVYFQLFHAGRNAKRQITGHDPIAPSSIISPIAKEIPKEMTLDDIRTVQDAFRMGALRSLKSGADGIEISGSAGYLISQFLSPRTNKRTDIYGENPFLFLHEIVRSIRDVVGEEYPIILRLSGSDMIPGGYSLSLTKDLIASFREEQINGINITGGSPVPQVSAHVPPGGYAFMAKELKNYSNLPFIASNRIDDFKIASQIISQGYADFVAIGRGLVADPEFPRKIKYSTSPIRKCQACNQGCIDNLFKGEPLTCMVNGLAGYEDEYKMTSTDQPRRILVVGGGLSGMEAARLAAIRGHNVVLCTKDEVLGGQLNIASIPPYKKELKEFINFLKQELDRLSVQVLLNTNVDMPFIDQMKPDYIILATGSLPIIPTIEGLKKNNTFTAQEIITADNDFIESLSSKNIVIVGGGSVGLETAHYLEQKLSPHKNVRSFLDRYVDDKLQKQLKISPHITVIEMGSFIGAEMGKSTRWILLNELQKLGIKTITNSRVISVDEKRVFYESEGHVESAPADVIILSIGSRSYGMNLKEALDNSSYAYSIIGDALRPKNVLENTREAVQIAASL